MSDENRPSFPPGQGGDEPGSLSSFRVPQFRDVGPIRARACVGLPGCTVFDPYW